MGAIFDRSYCCNAICGPSRANIVSGKHSSANGFLKNCGKDFDFTQSTFVKSLKESGYQTALIGKWHLGSHNLGKSPFDYLQVWHGGYYNPSFTAKDGTQKREIGYSTTLIGNKTIDWINKRDPSKPFMIMCTFNASHRTWAPDLKYLNKYKGEIIPEPKTLFDHWDGRSPTLKGNHMSIDKHFYYSYDLKVYEPVPWASTREKWLKDREIKHMTPEQRKVWLAAFEPENKKFIKDHPTGKDLIRWKYQRYIKNYIRCVCSIDDEVGKMLDYLKKNGLLDNTIIVYTSDQGFYLGEHGWYDKRWMFEESFRIPFIMYWKGVTKPGEHINQLVQNIDMAPTLIKAAGLEVPSDMQGLNLIPLIEGKKVAWRNELYYHYFEAGGEHNVSAQEGVKTDRYKLINFYQNDGFNLFDLKNDPDEMKNVANNPEYAAVLKTMKAKLKELRKQYHEPPLK